MYIIGTIWGCSNLCNFFFGTALEMSLYWYFVVFETQVDVFLFDHNFTELVQVW